MFELNQNLIFINRLINKYFSDSSKQKREPNYDFSWRIKLINESLVNFSE